MCEELLSCIPETHSFINLSCVCVCVCACEHRQMCPNLENYTTQQLLFPGTCNVAEFSPFLEGESGDGLLAYVTVHIAHTHTHTHTVTDIQGLACADILHLVSDIAYASKCCASTYGHVCHVYSSEVTSPLHSHTRHQTHILFLLEKRVSPRGVPFKSASFRVPVNHSCSRHNIRWSRRAGGTVKRKRTAVLWKCGVWQIERQTSPQGSQDSSCEWPRCAQQVAGLYRSPGFGGAVAHCADCGHIKHTFMIERPYLGFTGSSDLLMCYLIWRFILLCIIIIKDQLRQH